MLVMYPPKSLHCIGHSDPFSPPTPPPTTPHSLPPNRLGGLVVKASASTPALAPHTPSQNHLGGLVVKASASRAEDPGFRSCFRRDFSG